MKFRAPGDEPISVGLTTGHSIVITHKKEGTTVPPKFRKAAVALGCVPLGAGVEDESDATPPEATKEEKIIEGINKMLDGDDDSAFTGDGRPDSRKLAEVVGFNVTKAERDAAWEKVSAGMSDPDGTE